MPADSEAPSDTAAPSFEEALRRLEAIVESLEGEPPALDEALAAYEDGVALARQCLGRLSAAELRVEELSTQLIDEEL